MSESKEEKRQRKEAKKAEKEAKKEATRKDLEQIEIDLAADVPLNKKQQRLLKKGKLNLDKLKAKHPTPRAADAPEEEPKRSKFGVWVGNLSFDTTREDILRYLKAKIDDLDDDDITRFNLPSKQGKIKGFCYIDFKTQEITDKVIALSEGNLNGRNLLIKNANSFEGRPEPQSTALVNPSKNPPSRILFVGNLSFDTTQDLLEEHFRHCGDIIKIRMATFEDTGKCKGFAFIDFKDESGPTNALTSKLTKKLINRPLRMEYGEDRSKRTPKRILELAARERVDGAVHSDRQANFERPERSERPDFPRPERSDVPERRKREYKPREDPNKRVKSSVALASAQRASAAIVPSAGKKTTFD